MCLNSRAMGQFYASSLNFLYPQHCAVCQCRIRKNGGGRHPPPLCLPCCPWSCQEEFVAPGCPRCGTPAHDNSTCCLSCMAKPFPMENIFSLFWYLGRAEAMMKAFKYRAQWPLGPLFGEMLFRRLQSFEWAIENCLSTDLIVPIPMSNQTFLNRGFHQTAIIARTLSRRLHLPLCCRALWTEGATEHQASLRTLASRWSNVDRVFQANRRLVTGRRVLLLDDVLTTGATLSTAAQTLLNAGAESVRALTICRSTAFIDYRQEEIRSS